MESRLTFRDPAHDVAWQRQLRDKYLDEGVPDVPHLKVKKAIVRPVGRNLAKQIIYKYEWLGTMAPTRYHHGIFFGDFCAGVTCVGGTNCTGGTQSHKMFKIQREELLILARGACVHWSPNGSNSKLVSWTVRLLAEQKLGKVLIAYADTDAGEIGTIYQACNWHYIGRGGTTEQYISPNGRIYDHQIINQILRNHGLVGKVSWSEQKRYMMQNGWTAQKSNPKHRYVAILDKSDKALVQRIHLMSKPYPKRGNSNE